MVLGQELWAEQQAWQAAHKDDETAFTKAKLEQLRQTI